MERPFRYLFGPVPSRRLGRSLGLDVTPDKTCSFDCVYCQCGRTLHLQPQRGEFVPFDELCAEFDAWLDRDGVADTITFAGSGEPTLYNRLGDLIAFIKSRCPIPVAVLSNGSLLSNPQIRRELGMADLVKLSLSAWDEASFQAVHRPAPGITFAQMLEGQRTFRNEFRGTLWLEVLLIAGINDSPEQVRRIAKAAESIRADCIHLNTVVRPPTERAIRPVQASQLARLCDLFTPRAEVIAPAVPAPAKGDPPTRETLAGLLRRHPATAAELAAHFNLPEESLLPLLSGEPFRTESRNGKTYYQCS